ncbi:MAG: NAD-dependent epimerase/dehydratase family protein, partial [Thiohalomonadales bacterium]
GTGQARREFLHVDDLASAALYLMQNYNAEQIVNVGTGIDISIAEVARLMGEIVGFEGELAFDSSKPDGPPRKLLDVSSLGELGWRYKIDLREGLAMTYAWYEQHVETARV